MHDAILAVLILMAGGSPSESNPVALVNDLGSSRFNQREAAEKSLGLMGRIALPALRAALSNKDPEIRSRAALIVNRIEGSLLVEPTMVTLDFSESLLPDALATINQRSGLRLSLTPDGPGVWLGRRLSVREDGAIPFWKAIDSICEAGQLHYVFGGQSDFEHGDSTFGLYDGFASSQGMFSDHGPFRVQLASLRYESELHLSTERAKVEKARSGEIGRDSSLKPRELASKQFFLQMLVGAEPRLSLAPAGAVKLLEAVDDQGHSLVIPGQDEIVNHDSGYLGVNSSPLIHLRVDLAYPERSGSRLKKIKGAIPVIVSTRRPEPIEIPLNDASGKSFTQNTVKLSVGELHLGGPDQAATIELSIKVADDQNRSTDLNGDNGDLRSIASPQQLEVVDAAGRMIPWFPSSSFFNGEEAKLTLTLLDRGMPMVPTLIRYHEVIRNRTEVPFEFRNLPLP